MYPILVDWGPFFLPAWHVFFVLGAIGAYFLLLRLNARSAWPVDRGFLNNAYIVAYLAGYFGARIFTIFLADEANGDFWHAVELAFTFGGMTFYGGFLTAALATSIYVAMRRVSYWVVFDLALPAGLLGLVIGRVGCFLNGDDYGIAVEGVTPETTPWWAVTFPNLADGVARYPVQLMEAGVVLLLVMALCFCFRSVQLRYGPGLIGMAATASYAVARIGLEFFRGDERGWWIENQVSTSQGIGLIILLVVAGLLITWLLRRPNHEVPRSL